jgi:ubiquitin-like 1-activating enzyme E1 B
MSDSRYASLIATFGQENFDRVKASRVLVIGAGGIGCELLKNLVQCGFLTIEIIDLDTIDVSNLNRQFLFRNEHVGQPKAVVAAAAAMAFNPDAKVTAHYGNVKDTKFGISYIQTFNIVLNALDNIDARRHVNRLCLAAEVPLIDSGTTGYLGQVMPIFKKRTACYECAPKPTPKVYPICTIRSTPDKPVHCIVWAKEAFKLVFGNTSESMLYEDPASGEESTYMALVPLPPHIPTTGNGNGNSDGDAAPSSANGSADAAAVVAHGARLLVALYHDEVQKRIDMGIYQTAKTAPQPVAAAVIEAASARAAAIVGGGGAAVPPSQGAEWDRAVWSDEDCAVEMLLCLWEAVALSRASGGAGLFGKMAFDKDDAVAMRFVTAAANLRCRVFGIPAQSFYDAKGIAGNIIPAIATTNAIVAGIQVLQAFKVVAAGKDLTDATAALCPHTYCLRGTTRRGNLLQPSQPEEPNAQCFVCSAAHQSLQIDTSKATLGDLLKHVVKGKLGFNAPSILVGHSMLYEEVPSPAP